MANTLKGCVPRPTDGMVLSPPPPMASKENGNIFPLSLIPPVGLWNSNLMPNWELREKKSGWNQQEQLKEGEHLLGCVFVAIPLSSGKAAG